jgi:predicted deacylase
MAVTDVPSPALEGMRHSRLNSGRGVDLIDTNREWLGNESAASAPNRHAGLLFNRLLRPNADAAIDFHTWTTGLDVSAFNIAGMDVPRSSRWPSSILSVRFSTIIYISLFCTKRLSTWTLQASRQRLAPRAF